MKKVMVLLSVLCCVAAANASIMTVAYWELDGASWDGRDSVGNNDLVKLVGTGGVDTAIRVDPIPNPDTSVWKGVNSAASNPRASYLANTAWVQPNSGVEAEHNSTFDFDPTKSFTVEGWYRTSFGGVIIGNRQWNSSAYGNSGKGWAVYTGGSGTALYFLVDGAAGSGASRTITVSGLTAGVNTHFAAVYDKDGFAPGIGQMELYVDGVLKGSAVASDQWSWHRGGSLAIGARDLGSGYTNSPFNGGVDEIRYVNAALSPEYFLNGTTPIPEPATLLLLTFGGGLLLRKRQ